MSETWKGYGLAGAVYAERDGKILLLKRAGGTASGGWYIPGGAIVNWPLRRKVLSRVANSYIRAVTRLSARDCTSGYRCWRRSTLAAVPLDRLVSDGYSFLVEMLFVASRSGCRIAEVPITFVERREGESKVSRAVLLESAITPWRLISNPTANMRKERLDSVR